MTITAGNITIEETPVSEWSKVADITREAYAEYAASSDKSFWSMYEKSTENTLLHDEFAIRLVAKRGNEIFGSVLYCPPYKRKIGGREINNIFPEMRLLAVPPSNRNLGIAGALICYCEDKAAATGFDTITLHTTVLMQTAKAMYERRGYVRYPELDFEPVPGFTVWGYRKELKL
jgi:GNAT superfamily N-acetyltransferase